MKLRQRIFEVLIIFLCSLTPLLWMKPGETVVGHDSGFRLAPWAYASHLVTTWDHTANFGADTSLTKGFILTQIPEIFATAATSSFAVGQSLSFVFWFFIMGISMYICMIGFFSRREFWLLRLYTSIFWMYNFYILQGWFITERAKFSLFAALPLALVVTVKALTHVYKPVSSAIMFALIFFFLNGGGSPPLYGAVVLTIGLAYLYHLSRALLQKQWRESFFIVRTGILFVGITIVLNSYWILPQIYLALRSYGSRLGSVGGIEGILSWEKAVNQYASYTNLLRLQGIPDWYENPNHPYAHPFLTNPFLIVSSFLPFALILVGVMRQHVLNYKKKGAVWQEFPLFLLLFFIGLLFAAGSHEPLGFLYIFFIKTIPGFAIFRSAFYKFAPVFWFAMITLSGYFLTMLLKEIKLRWLQNLLACASILAILLFHYPYFWGVHFLWNKPFTTKVRIPEYVPAMMDYLSTHTTKDDHILLLPELDPQFHADSYRWGYWSLDVLARLYVPPAGIVANDASSPPFITELYNAVRNDDEEKFRALAIQAHVTHVLWRDDVLYSDKITTVQPFRSFKERVEQWDGVVKEQEKGSWILYRLTYPFAEQFRCSTGLVVRDQEGAVETDTITHKALSTLPKDVEALIRQDYHEVSCYFCNPRAILKLESQLPLTYPRFLPDSPFYPLTQWKEQWQERKVLDPVTAANTHVIFATKRMIELKEMLKRDKQESRKDQIIQTLIEYKKRIEQAYNDIHVLGGKPKNDALGTLLGGIHAHQKYLASFTDLEGTEDILAEMYGFLNEMEQKVDGQLIVSTESVKYFQVSLPIDGIYTMQLDTYEKPIRVRLDTLDVDWTQPVSLTAGEHEITVEYPEQQNFLPENSLSILLPSGGEKRIAVDALTWKRSYLVTFKYQVAGGKAPLFSIEQFNDPLVKGWQKQRAVSQILIEDGKWHNLTFEVTPRFGSDQIDIVFTSKSDPLFPSAILFSDMSVTPIRTPSLSVVQNHATESKKIMVQTTQISPTIFRVSTVEPCLLVSPKQYDSGWQAVPFTFNAHTNLGEFTVLLQTILTGWDRRFTHVSLNSYANGWYIPEKGDVLVVYIPQLLFILGIHISTIAVIGMGMYGIKKILV